jgi:glycosyltransferase involved in cell wall biosynthesis
MRMTPLKVLISAYSCEPAAGSEPGVGWNVAREVAQHHEVWLVTRTHHRKAIEDELRVRPIPSLHVIYYDLPGVFRFWDAEAWGMQVHYYLWQVGVFPLVRRLHRSVSFDLTHHVTFVKYWQPSLLPRLDVPCLWGPVGGADASPRGFQQDLSWTGQAYEMVRNAAVWCGERDPMVVATARGSTLALATTPVTAARLEVLGARHVEVFSAIGLTDNEQAMLQRLTVPAGGPVRFLSMGRLLHWKAFHLGLRAFAAADLPDAEYWVIGDGPARAHLERLSRELGIAERVRFWGGMSRPAVLEKLGMCHVLVHPSLHDSGSCVCLEALAAGRPVICLDLAGPAELVTADCGIKIDARTPDGAVAAMAAAMHQLAADPALRHRLGQAGRARVAAEYLWSLKGRRLAGYYARVIAVPLAHPVPVIA